MEVAPLLRLSAGRSLSLRVIASDEEMMEESLARYSMDSSSLQISNWLSGQSWRV